MFHQIILPNLSLQRHIVVSGTQQQLFVLLKKEAKKSKLLLQRPQFSSQIRLYFPFIVYAQQQCPEQSHKGRKRAMKTMFDKI